MLCKRKDLSFASIFFLALFLRLLLIGYARIHDSLFELKYTDIDYKVFTDAASYVYEGESPYRRDTYRYTPLIAFFLLPNVIYFNEFGKILFSIFDILTGYFVKKILISLNVPLERSKILIAIYLFNPISLAISTRGNADGLICFFIISSIYFHINNWIIFSSIALGFSIHLKLYPIIYLLPFWISLYNKPIVAEFITSIKKDNGFSNLLSSGTSLVCDLICYINSNHVKFLITIITTLLYLTVTFYNIYNYEFLDVTYLYHITRLDHRHNLSLYFYYIYHLVDSHLRLDFFAHLFFQLICVLGCGILINDLILSMCLQTIIFIALNKVCTCQYFLWWLCLLPLALSKVNFDKENVKSLGSAGLLFLGSLIFWFFFGYLLEFLGISTYNYLLFSSIIFTYSQFNLAWKIYQISQSQPIKRTKDN